MLIVKIGMICSVLCMGQSIYCVIMWVLQIGIRKKTEKKILYKNCEYDGFETPCQVKLNVQVKSVCKNKSHNNYLIIKMETQPRSRTNRVATQPHR